MATTFPGLSDAMTNAVSRFIAGAWNPLDQNFRARRHRIHSRISYPDGGQTNDFQFFNSDPADEYIGNMKAQGLPPETVAIVYSLGLKLETGFTVGGTAAPTGNQAGIGTTVANTTVGEQMRQIYENGVVNLKFGDQIVLEDIHGVNTFPDGSGVAVDGFGWGTTTTQQAGAMIVNNGIPSVENRLLFTPVAILLPQKRVRLSIRYKTAIDITAAEVAAFKATLDCTLITPVNN